VEAVALDQVPPAVTDAALKVAALVGSGLYGVDLKTRDERVYVVEINDNPNVDAGYEDKIQGRAVYRRIMASFLARLEARHKREERE
jgi:glutathione synthase/RimK-type ligase-like ATP-grasp enzyme